MKFREFLKEYDSSDDMDNLDLANDGEVEFSDEMFFKKNFNNVYEIEYDDEGYPIEIERKKGNIEAKDKAVVKRWIEWFNKNNPNKKNIYLRSIDVGSPALIINH